MTLVLLMLLMTTFIPFVIKSVLVFLEIKLVLTELLQPGLPNAIYFSPLVMRKFQRSQYSYWEIGGIDGITSNLWKSISHTIVSVLCHVTDILS
ncbi:hypothetical protein HOLleu_02549 [Holothuria leucospilota]|uniref:Uncharacterized protein n=1 Tax=Holothuria leucospilota TaxID=206669 RepID=A0A9Q1CPS3_HOLLE|nr:hypothetical protein HOLleu_02549 [Holothuria leucospilota]